jgi:hypothetical protein
MSKEKLTLATVKQNFFGAAENSKKYTSIMFVVLLVVLYGFTFMRIQSLRSAEPSPEAISSQVKATGVPQIDEKVVEKLRSLSDNSASVKTLFDQTRSNPFKE